jgi:hypothetical protein
MSGGDQPSEEAEPTFLGELKLLKQKGLRRRPASLRLPLLERAADALSKHPDSPPELRLKEALERASGQLAEKQRTAAAALLDFGPLATKSSRGDDKKIGQVKYRQQAAAEVLGQTTEYFRRYTEKQLLGELADKLEQLVAEREAKNGSPATRDQAADPTLSRSEPLPEDAPDAAIPDELPPSTREPARRPWRRWRWPAVGAVGALLVALGVVALLNGPGDAGHRKASLQGSAAVLPDDCSRTTSQLFNPYVRTRALVASSELYMAAPHQRSPDTHHGWVKVLEYHNPTARIEVIHAATVRELALSYHNYSQHLAQGVTAKVALPPGATLLPQSVCLYRGGQYKYGTRYTSAALIGSAGLGIGNYAPGTSVYVTFSMLLPDVRHLSCGRSEVATYGKAATEGPGEPDWAQNASGVVIDFERRCHS